MNENIDKAKDAIKEQSAKASAQADKAHQAVNKAIRGAGKKNLLIGFGVIVVVAIAIALFRG